MPLYDYLLLWIECFVEVQVSDDLPQFTVAVANVIIIMKLIYCWNIYLINYNICCGSVSSPYLALTISADTLVTEGPHMVINDNCVIRINCSCPSCSNIISEYKDVFHLWLGEVRIHVCALAV